VKQKNVDLIVKELVAISTHLDRVETANVAMIKILSDRMARIEQAQTEQLKHLNRVVEYLSFIKEAYKKHDGDELDRGQTSSALYGLIKRLDEFENNVLAEIAVDQPLNKPQPTYRPKKKEPA
jgi:phage host-nuclease inhibitor protein Gam